MRLAKFTRYFNAYLSNHHQHDPHALTAVGEALVEDTPRLIRLSIWIMLAFIMFLVGWAGMAQVDEVVSATGKTLSQSPQYRVQATVTGELNELYIREGQIVNIGDPLMRLEHSPQQEKASVNAPDELSLVVSPVRGMVKHILVDTTNGQVLPGRTLVEITPLDDKLLIEARVSLKDMAFFTPRPGGGNHFRRL
ncbi:hypothetical protein [Dickeya oryzae]